MSHLDWGFIILRTKLCSRSVSNIRVLALGIVNELIFWLCSDQSKSCLCSIKKKVALRDCMPMYLYITCIMDGLEASFIGMQDYYFNLTFSEDIIL